MSFHCLIQQLPASPLSQLMKAQSQRCFPAATCAPSCSFMHSSSWAREPDHKDALLLFWLQLTSPWFLSSSFWASSCLSPKSQNWSALSHSNWDWTRDMCFIEGKPTHCAYMIFNAIYRGTHVSKYTGTCMFLLFALFAFSSPLIDRDRFFPYNYFLLCSFFYVEVTFCKCYYWIQDSYLCLPIIYHSFTRQVQFQPLHSPYESISI